MAMPDTSTYTFVLGATGEETLPGTITTGFTLAEDESWYKITYGTMSKTKGPYWYNPSKSDTLTYWTLKMVDVDDPTVMLDDGWLNGGPDLAPQAKSSRGSGETVQLPDLRQIASEQFRGKTIGLMPYNIALYGKLSVTITTFHHTYSVTYRTPTGGTVGAKINSGSAYYTTGAKRGDT